MYCEKCKKTGGCEHADVQFPYSLPAEMTRLERQLKETQKKLEETEKQLKETKLQLGKVKDFHDKDGKALVRVTHIQTDLYSRLISAHNVLQDSAVLVKGSNEYLHEEGKSTYKAMILEARAIAKHIPAERADELHNFELEGVA